MKLLYVSLARTIWIFDVRLLNPKGLSTQDLFQKLGERYQFAKIPKHPLDFNEQKALSFDSGTFINSQRLSVGVTFALWNNGVTAETISSTNDATEFLKDLFGWASAEYGLWIPSGNGLKKGYLSQVDVECERPIISINPTLEIVSRMIENRYSPLDGKAREFFMGGIQFWTEDVNQPLAPAGFRFERKWGVPTDENHYFSQAPLETQDHLDLLNELEKVFTPESG